MGLITIAPLKVSSEPVQQKRQLIDQGYNQADASQVSSEPVQQNRQGYDQTDANQLKEVVRSAVQSLIPELINQLVLVLVPVLVKEIEPMITVHMAPVLAGNVSTLVADELKKRAIATCQSCQKS